MGHRIILSHGKNYRYGKGKSWNFIFKIEWEPCKSSDGGTVDLHACNMLVVFVCESRSDLRGGQQ